MQDKVRNRLCVEVQSKIDTALAGTGVNANVSAAKFLEGTGLLLHDVELVTPQLRMFAYETFLHMPCTTTDLVMGAGKPTAVELRRVKFEFAREANSSFDFQSLIDACQSWASKADQSQKLIPVRVRDSQFTLLDRSTGIQKVISNIDLDFTPVNISGRELFEVTLNASSNDIRELSAKAFIDPQTSQYKFQANLNRARVHRAWLSLIPNSMQHHAQYVRSINGVVELAGQAAGDFRSGQLPEFFVTAKCNDMNFDDSRLPFPMLDGKAEFSVSNASVRVEKASGRIGNGDFGFQFRQNGLGVPKVWQLEGFFNRFDFGHLTSMEAFLPGFCSKFCKTFSPTGICSISGTLVSDGRDIKKNLDGHIVDMGFNYLRFPYQLDHCVGTVKWVDDLLSYQMECDQKDRVLMVSGQIQRPGPMATYETHLKADGTMPIDEKLLTAVDAIPKFSKIVRDFNPNGRITGTGLITKLQPGGPVNKAFDVELVDVSMRHNHFQYPIEAVSGVIQSRNLDFTFDNLTGSNGIGTISASGQWNPTNGLNARYICNQVQLDERLRFALRPELKEIWDGFRPRGTAELIKVDMALPIGATDCNIVLDADLAPPENGISASNVSIFPTWFPYEINEVGGKIQVGNGQVRVSNFKGKHGRSFVTCQGSGEYDDEAWSVTLQKMLVLALKVDENLFAALPSSLVPQVRALNFEGLLNVNGEITLAGLLQDEGENPKAELAHWTNRESAIDVQIRQTGFEDKAAPRKHVGRPIYMREESSFQDNTTMAWDLRFDMIQSNMMVGLPISNVFGKVNLNGVYDGETAKCRGELQLDSLTIYDAQVTNVTGPIWLDNNLAAGGSLAIDYINKNNASTVSPLPSRPLQQRSISGESYGGIVRFDAVMNADEKGEFYLRTTVADANLKTFCQEFAPQMEQIAGHGFCALELTGDAPNIDSYRGRGVAQLRDAQIYELPTVLSLLKLLQIKQVDRTAFDTGNIDFSVNGENIDLNRMEFNGDAISLIGNGSVNLNRDLDVNFYSVMGRNKFNVPLISDLYRAGSQRILWIKVGGTCNNPVMKRQVLPQLNDSIRQLFQQPNPR